jgi:hypothetical protein
MQFTPTDVVEALDVNELDRALLDMFAGRDRKSAYFECAMLMHQQREEFLESLQNVCDDDDLKVLIACRYIEQKSRWLQWNLSMNYKMLMTGTYDGELALKACALSFLLGRIEPFIDPESLDRINDLLNEPLAAKVS